MNDQQPRSGSRWEPAASPQAGAGTLPPWSRPMTPTPYDAPPARRASWWQRNRANVAGAALGLTVTGLVGGFVVGNSAPTPPQGGQSGQVTTPVTPSNGHQGFSGHSSGDGEGEGTDVADAS